MTTTGRICPGKRSVFDDNCRERSPRATDLDSSFNFGSASETNDDDKEGILSVSHISVANVSSSESSISDTDSDNSFNSEGEVWDEME